MKPHLSIHKYIQDYVNKEDTVRWAIETPNLPLPKYVPEKKQKWSLSALTAFSRDMIYDLRP